MWSNIELISFMVPSFNLMPHALDSNLTHINNIGRELMYSNIANIFIAMDSI